MADALNVDEARFHGDGGDLTLLHWLRQAEQAIETLEPDVLSPTIPLLHTLFLHILTPPPSPSLPKPGRPIRHLVARSLVKLHKKVESRALFDLVQALVKAVDGGNKNMGAAENVARVACWYTIGELIKEHGANMMSFMAEITTSSVRVLRQTNYSVLLRTHAVLAFAKCLYAAGRALPDALVKDLLKALRAGLSDKALPVQRATAEAFVALHQHTAALVLPSTINDVSPLVLKSLETADFNTRRALSRLLAHLLAATQVPGSAAPVVDKKKETEPEGPTVLTSAPENKGGKTLYTVAEMLRHLSVPYNKPQTPRRLRNAILDIYATLFTTLGNAFIESNYAEIIRHIVDELVIKSQSTRYDSLAVRDAAAILIRDLVGVRMLSEAAQVAAIREWANMYVRKWQATSLPGHVNPNPQALIVALREVAALLGQIGNASPAIIELVAEPLVRLHAHDSYSVRLAAASALRKFCESNPGQLPRILGGLFTDINKDLALPNTPTAPKDLSQRLIGKTIGLSSLLSLAQARPLYVSHDVPTKAFDLAVSLLKRAGDNDAVQVQVAWHIVAALMSIGPGFVKLHLPQLLVLWRNALPKPTSKDTSVGERGETEWSFLLLSRECALAAVYNFLRHNSALVNIDVARRLATLFTNSLNFVNGFATAYAEALREQAANPAASPVFTLRPSLVDREANLRRRVLQCFTALGPSSATEAMQPALLQAAVTVFADPENYSGSAAQAAIAAQAGQFVNVWQSTDGYAFGVTSLIAARDDMEGFLNRDQVELSIESLLSHPILGSVEHDYVTLFSSTLDASPRPVPAQTGVIDAGVELFAALFAYQNLEGQVQSLATLSSHVRSSKLEKNPGRRQAVVANTMTAIRRSLSNAEGDRSRKTLGGQQVSDLIKSLLQDAVLDPNPNVREAAADAMGLLSHIAGSTYLSSQVQWLVDQVVNNRVPDSRAGCAIAFGAIYGRVGGMAGGPILKTIVNILMSLATDPHPVVHFWSMVALTQVVNSANLSYEPYVPTTLGMLASIYLLETHEPDGGSLGSVNLRGDLPAYQVISRLLHALIGVIGPELQEPGKIRSLVFLLVHEFGEEVDEGLAVEAIKCVQQFLMFAPAEVDVPKLVKTFRSHLASKRRPLKVAAITALYQIVQRDAVLMSKIGGNQLVEDLFGLLDDDPSLDGVRNVITSWLQQTAAALPSGWIDLCQRIMNRMSAAKAPAPVQQSGLSFMDDEGESLGAAVGSSAAAQTSRWRTQLFALECLHNIVVAVAESGKTEHFDPLQAHAVANKRGMLWSRVGDLIRMAFSASAALVEDVRLAGLVVLRDVIERFASSPDPDFESALLLEQHQAPVAAALTPSFGADSTPQVLASAVQVCAVFVGSGVVKEVGRMGRILKLLIGALEQCKTGEMVSLGDVANLASSAAIMLKISILAAWAELQIASARQSYLVEVVRPYRWLLGPLWVGALRDYAQLRTDPEMGVGAADLGAGMGRDVLLPYYESAVPKLLHAVAIALASSDPFMLGAVDGQTYTSAVEPTSLPTIRSEPSSSFHILYGLSFESLVRSLGDDASMALVALKAIATLVRPELAGTGAFDGAFFDELCTVAYRIALSEGATVKAGMVEMMAGYVVTRKGSPAADAAQTRRALAIVAFTLRQTIPAPGLSPTFLPSDSAADRAAFLRTTFLAYTRIVESIDLGQRADLSAVAIHLFADMLRAETPHDLAGACLPSLRLVLDQCLSTQVPAVTATAERVVHGLLSACLGNIDDLAARVNPIANVKIKNNLLALVLVLTALPANTRVSRPVVEQIAYTVGTYLGAGAERPELGLAAVHCASSLLQASLRAQAGSTGAQPRPAPVLQHAALHLLPHLITFLADAAVASTDAALPAATLDAAREIVRALVSWVAALPEPAKPRGYAVLLPTLCVLLDPGAAGAAAPSPLHALATSTALALAQGAPKAFKDATAGMAEGERAQLERAIRDAVGAHAHAHGRSEAGVEKKGIELRSFE
ncbi:hypothetical protein Q5752_002682 [Cryptotrichosporon argae]